MKAILKNNFIKVLLLIICMAFILTGCATVSDVRNPDGSRIYFDDIVYFEGQIAVIGDYVYYGNSYTASDGDSFDYNAAAETGYMSRLNIGSTLQYSSEEDEDGYVNPSPIGVEQVDDERLIGYQNQYMFALGDYIYFTSANTHRTSNLENDYTQVTLFRVKFNGDKLQEIDTFRYDENSVITAEKGSDGNYYYIIYSPTTSDAESYNLYSIRIGDRIGDTVTLAEDVNSVTVCDENSTIKNVVYTVDSERTDRATTAVKAVDFATGDVTDYGNNTDVVRTTTEMLERIGDIVIYSYTDQNTVARVCYKNLVTDDKYFSGDKQFYTLSPISNIQEAGDGYIFVSDTTSSVMYKTTLGTEVDEKILLTSADYTDILFVDGDYVYYSNDTSISRINVRDNQIQTMVSMTSIISGQCGYDGDYIYFYAQLEDTSSSDDSDTSDEDTTQADANYYMYRVDKTGANSDGEYAIELLSRVEKPE